MKKLFIISMFAIVSAPFQVHGMQALKRGIARFVSKVPAPNINLPEPKIETRRVSVPVFRNRYAAGNQYMYQPKENIAYRTAQQERLQAVLSTSNNNMNFRREYAFVANNQASLTSAETAVEACSAGKRKYGLTLGILTAMQMSAPLTKYNAIGV